VKRRDFIAGLGGAAAWPLVVRAQQSAVPVVGILGSATAESYALPLAAVIQGLKETGFVEHQNVALEQRWANGQYDRLPELAADLVRSRVSLIAAIGNNLPTRAAKGATSTIPIVFAMGTDPVELGLVASLNRPGGNITGITNLSGEVTQKRLQLLHDLLPNARRFGYVANPDNSTTVALARDAARIWGGMLELAYARAAHEFDAAFANFAERRVEAVATAPDALFVSERGRIIQLAAQHEIPTMYLSPEAVRAGGLMSYSASVPAVFRQVGLYAGRILKGEKPADLPVIRATKFEFVINLKTAKALGLEIPAGVLALADEVIE